MEDPRPCRRLTDPRRRSLRGRGRGRRWFDGPGGSQPVQPGVVPHCGRDAPRQGPKDAGMEALRRIKANQVEKRLLNARGEPNFNINFYIVNAKGEHAGVTMHTPASCRLRSATRKARGWSAWSRCCRGRRSRSAVRRAVRGCGWGWLVAVGRASDPADSLSAQHSRQVKAEAQHRAPAHRDGSTRIAGAVGASVNGSSGWTRKNSASVCRRQAGRSRDRRRCRGDSAPLRARPGPPAACDWRQARS